MKAGRRTLRISIAAIAVIGVLAVGVVVLHSPATHRLAVHLHAPHGGGPGTAIVGEPGADAAATARALAGVAAIGRRWDAAAFAETVRLYTAVHREIQWPGVLEAETIHYGADAEQAFDLYRPEQGFSEPGPVFVFMPGNGLGDSDRVAPGSDGLIYSHLGKLAATAGSIGVVMNYRNGPGDGLGNGPDNGLAATLEPGAEDLHLVIEWLAGHIAPYGGDSNTIVLAANSEGATTAAAYLFNEAWQLPSGPGVAAAMLISGRFGALAPEIADLVDTYDGERVPLALWAGEFDALTVADGIDALDEQLCAKYGDCPAYQVIAGHNHVSHLMSLGTSDTSALNALIRFYHTVR